MSDLESMNLDIGNVGFVTIVGRPNVGKSTFLNQVLKYHLAAVSSRPNTTRKRWLGILSDDDSQIIFADTPGVHETKNKMHEAMAKTIQNSISRNDLVLAICDATREFGDEDTMVCEALQESDKPVILAVNKVDKASKSALKKIKDLYLSYLGKDTVTHEISASENVNIDELLSSIKSALPRGPFLYPKDQVADAFLRDIAEEIIRESANELIFHEIPHSLAVKIEKWNETDKKIKVSAAIYVERDSQKAIVIGEGGKMIKDISKSAREKLHEDLEKFIDLKLFVKTSPDWQNKVSFLKDFGVVDYE